MSATLISLIQSSALACSLATSAVPTGINLGAGGMVRTHDPREIIEACKTVPRCEGDPAFEAVWPSGSVCTLALDPKSDGPVEYPTHLWPPMGDDGVLVHMPSSDINKINAECNQWMTAAQCERQKRTGCEFDVAEGAECSGANSRDPDELARSIGYGCDGCLMTPDDIADMARFNQTPLATRLAKITTGPPLDIAPRATAITPQSLAADWPEAQMTTPVGLPIFFALMQFYAGAGTAVIVLCVQPVSATPLAVYRLAFGSPRSFADVD